MATLNKDSLIKGTIILALAALVARALGLFQRIPIEYMLLEDGQIAFNSANQIYLLLLVVATAGFPSAISRMVSERMSLGKYYEAKRVYHGALWFGGVTGLVLAVGLFIFAPFYAEIVEKEHITLSVRAIAPALILFPLVAMMRGYFQGRQMMTAGGISQIVEQIARVVLGIGFGLVILLLGYSDEWTAAAITFGGVFGSIAAFLVMLSYAKKLKKQDKYLLAEMEKEHPQGAAGIEQEKQQATKFPLKSVYIEVFKMSLPALVTSMTINLLYLFDTTFFIKITKLVYDFDTATNALADFGTKAQSLAGIPPILAIALGTSIIPIISSAYARKDQAEVNKQASAVLRIVCLTGVPIALYLTVSSLSVTGLLFSNDRGYEIVAMLCAGTIFQITMMTTNSILYGMGYQKRSMYHTLIGIGVKIVVSIVLGALIGVAGFIIGSTLCFIVVTILNIRLINKDVTLHVFGSKWAKYIMTIIITAALCLVAEYGSLLWTSNLPMKLSYLVAVLISGTMLCLIYSILLIKLAIVTENDVESLPGKLRPLARKIISKIA